MHVLNTDLIRKADYYIDKKHAAFTDLGHKLFEQFGSDKGKISTQVRNLQRIACSATRFADIEDFVKNQMGKGNRPWQALGRDVLQQLTRLRNDSHELDDDPANQMALRLRLARGWVRAVVSGYLYQLALDQMRNTA